MGAEGARNLLKENRGDKLSAPPGFVSLTAFKLKREDSNGNHQNSVADELSSVRISFDLDDIGSAKSKLKLQHRPWILYDGINNNGERSSEHADNDMEPVSEARLPKGIIRGCRDCSNCQKVVARWDPQGAATNVLEEAPVFHPKEEDFIDIFKYIARIRQQVEPFGFCRLVPPTSWQSPSLFEGKDDWQIYELLTQVQNVNRLGIPLKRKSPDAGKDQRNNIKMKLTNNHAKGHNPDNNSDTLDNLKLKTSPQFTIESFKKYADYFKECYFSNEDGVADKASNPSEETVEGEYWRNVERPTHEIDVLRGDYVNSGTLGSRVPLSSEIEKTSPTHKDLGSSWNLNNIAQLPGSLLSFESSETSELLVPRLHFGMCFSRVQWKLEEHDLYALYYLHLGSPRIWYCVPPHCSNKFEAVMKQQFPPEDVHCPQRFHNLISPSKLKSENIPVIRCIQRPKEYILFLPGAYHSGIDSGFNCSQSSNVAPLDWLPHGENMVGIYRDNRRRPSISQDKVLLRAANEAVQAQWDALLLGKKSLRDPKWKDAYGKSGVLAKVLKLRIKSEARQRDCLTVSSRAKKMDRDFLSVSNRECFYCYSDLYLSAARCSCTPDHYSCLHHTKYLCTCGWSDKLFLFRYKMSELNVLADALEGKFAAFRQWVKEDLGAALGCQYLGEADGPVADSASNKSQDEVTKSDAWIVTGRHKSGIPYSKKISSVPVKPPSKGISESTNGKEKNRSAEKVLPKKRKRALSSDEMDSPLAKEVEVAKARIREAAKRTFGDLSDFDDTSSSSSSSSEDSDDDIQSLLRCLKKDVHTRDSKERNIRNLSHWKETEIKFGGCS